ncbi:MAG: HD domain-containing protein, partial [Flavobacteriaceae bacterium]
MSKLVEKTDKFVFDLFKNELDNSFLYHNYTHTQRVLKSTNEILENIEMDDKEKEIIRLSALLHDTGYTKDRENHEKESIKIAESFLKDENVDEKTIAAVSKCIAATEFNSEPETILGKIIRDADASHFGKKYFREASEFLRKELELQNIKKYSPTEWLDENIKVLSKKHQFYTDYALQNWQSRKEKNLAKLIKEKQKLKKKLKTEELKAKYKSRYKNESPERGIQTFYRVALRNHIK